MPPLANLLLTFLRASLLAAMMLVLMAKLVANGESQALEFKRPTGELREGQAPAGQPEHAAHGSGSSSSVARIDAAKR